MKRKLKYIFALIILLMCIKEDPMVLKAGGFFSYHSDPIIDEGLPYYLLIAGYVEFCFFIKYFLLYIAGKCRSASFIKRLIVAVVFGLLTLVSLYPDQRVFRHNSEVYSVRTQYEASSQAKVKSFTVSDKTIPEGIYQVSTSKSSNEIKTIIPRDKSRESTPFEKEVFETHSAGIIRHLEKPSYNNSNSFTVFLPEGSQVIVSSEDFKDFNTKVTFKKVDKFSEITHLSAEVNGMYQIPKNRKKLKIDINEKDECRTYKGPLTNVFTFNEEQLIEYKVYKDAYSKIIYKVDGDEVLMESTDDHFYEDEELKNGQISLDLLDKAFSYSSNNLEFRNFTIGT